MGSEERDSAGIRRGRLPDAAEMTGRGAGAFRGRRRYPAVAELETMTNTELMDLRAALEVCDVRSSSRQEGSVPDFDEP